MDNTYAAAASTSTSILTSTLTSNTPQGTAKVSNFSFTNPNNPPCTHVPTPPALVPNASAGRRMAQITNDEVQYMDVVDVDATQPEDDKNIEISTIIKRFHDSFGNKHWVAKYPTTTSARTGKKYTKARQCSKCGKNTCGFRYQCNVPLCYPIKSSNPHNRNCFRTHVMEHSRKTGKLNMYDSELIE